MLRLIESSIDLCRSFREPTKLQYFSEYVGTHTHTHTHTHRVAPTHQLPNREACCNDPNLCRVQDSDLTFRSFKKARAYMATLLFQNRTQFRLWAKSSKRPADIPFNPTCVYANKWVSWDHFLGHEAHVPDNNSSSVSRSFSRRSQVCALGVWIHALVCCMCDCGMLMLLCLCSCVCVCIWNALL